MRRNRVRGIDNPNHGYFGMTPQFISFVDKSHPITKGLGDGFYVTDEAYACHWFEDSVHPLARTDFQPADPTKNLNPKVKYSNLAAWVKVAENSPVFFTQVGHGFTAWAARPTGNSSATRSSGPHRLRRWPGRRRTRSGSSILPINGRETIMRNIFTKVSHGLAIALAMTAGSVSLFAQGQWGSGPIKVAIVTKGHNFDRDGFFNFWDSLGQDITWTHVQHPAALEFFDPALADTFDVYVFFDAPGTNRDARTRWQADVRAAERIGQEEPDSVPAEGKGARVLPSLARGVEPYMAGVRRDDRDGLRLGQSRDVQGQELSQLRCTGERETAHHRRQQDPSRSRRASATASISSMRRICAPSTKRPRG